MSSREISSSALLAERRRAIEEAAKVAETYGCGKPGCTRHHLGVLTYIVLTQMKEQRPPMTADRDAADELRKENLILRHHNITIASATLAERARAEKAESEVAALRRRVAIAVDALTFYATVMHGSRAQEALAALSPSPPAEEREIGTS